MSEKIGRALKQCNQLQFDTSIKGIELFDSGTMTSVSRSVDLGLVVFDFVNVNTLKNV